MSVARVERAWYVVCASTALRAKPLSTMLLGIPLVVFRGAGGEPGALLDRCPHRNVPLSLGRVREQLLECAFHGWQFERDGACAKIPCLVGETDTRGRSASAFPTCERDGFVWVWPSLEHAPTEEPFPLPLARDPQYSTIRRAVDVECLVHAAIENALDVLHTASLHQGLFRGGHVGDWWVGGGTCSSWCNSWQLWRISRSRRGGGMRVLMEVFGSQFD